MLLGRRSHRSSGPRYDSVAALPLPGVAKVGNPLPCFCLKIPYFVHKPHPELCYLRKLTQHLCYNLLSFAPTRFLQQLRVSTHILSITYPPLNALPELLAWDLLDKMSQSLSGTGLFVLLSVFALHLIVSVLLARIRRVARSVSFALPCLELGRKKKSLVHVSY